MSKIFKAIGSIFSPKMPNLPKPPAMPDPGSTASKLAAQKKIASRNKGGRDSTIYTGQSGAYQGLNLGGTA